MRPIRTNSRLAFTLIELLVVIAIIAVLVSLLVAGVMRVMKTGPDVQETTDIGNLQISVNNFKAKYGVFPPSRIKLFPNFTNYNLAINPANGLPVNPLDFESMSYITTIWPRMGQVQFVNYAWDGSSKQGTVLEGDQCLVFFLGGPGGTKGFSLDPQDPCRAKQNGAALPGENPIIFYQFQSFRLVNFRPSPVAGGPVFPSYINNWGPNVTNQLLPQGTPYAYFSSGKSPNGYNSGGNIPHAITLLGMDNVAPYYDTFTAPPYSSTNPHYLNSNSFQIISAGEDGRFTDGSLSYPVPRCHWNWTNGSSPLDSSPFWQDNRTNFSPNQLKVP